jgi:hypothetical protein
MSKATRDEADRYIASLIEGTEYAKRKDHEARLRMVAKYYGVTVGDVHAIEAALIHPIKGLIQEAVAKNAEEIVRAFVNLCQPPRPAGAADARQHMPKSALNDSQG